MSVTILVSKSNNFLGILKKWDVVIFAPNHKPKIVVRVINSERRVEVTVVRYFKSKYKLINWLNRLWLILRYSNVLTKISKK